MKKSFIVFLMIIWSAITQAVPVFPVAEHSVWVPARYTPSGEAGLYLADAEGVLRQYVDPDGRRDVGGFLENKEGYLVAVRLPARDLAKSWQPGFLFYQVDRHGKTLAFIGNLASHDATLIVGPQGLFARQMAQTDIRAWTYTGYSPEGTILAGPQAVYYASPSSTGGWYAVERRFESSTALRYLYLTIDPQGRRQEVASTALSTRRTLQYLPSTAIFVDTVPFADTVRTGGFGLGMYRDANSYDVPEPWLGGVIDFNRGIPNDKYFTRAIKLGLFHSEAAASELVSRMILFGRGPAGVQFVSQCAKGNDGICLLPGNSASPPVRLFELEGAAFSMLRKVFATNNDTMTVNSYNDAFGIIRGDSTVVVLGGAVQPTRLTKAVPELVELDATEADRFLAQYQATHRE